MSKTQLQHNPIRVVPVQSTPGMKFDGLRGMQVISLGNTLCRHLVSIRHRRDGVQKLEQRSRSEADGQQQLAQAALWGAITSKNQNLGAVPRRTPPLK